MRHGPEYFDQRDPVLVYIARRLKEAQGLERVLTEAGYDYVVAADKYVGGLIFRTERVGAFFYVAEEAAESVRAFILLRGYEPAEEPPAESEEQSSS
jgi:hypothetical protein